MERRRMEKRRVDVTHYVATGQPSPRKATPLGARMGPQPKEMHAEEPRWEAAAIVIEPQAWVR
jgi:hypothetical protein